MIDGSGNPAGHTRSGGRRRASQADSNRLGIGDGACCSVATRRGGALTMRSSRRSHTAKIFGGRCSAIASSFGDSPPQTAWLFCVRGTKSSNPAPSSEESVANSINQPNGDWEGKCIPCDLFQ
jgi:hypothetical protein